MRHMRRDLFFSANLSTVCDVGVKEHVRRQRQLKGGLEHTLMFAYELHTQICTTVLIEFWLECYIYNYFILHTTHAVDTRKGIWS